VEQVRGRSLPWADAEIESARDFRNAVVDSSCAGRRSVLS
jgi:light-regulated signal transduction histidine kinase (bacteriophytochrome)